MELFDKRFVHFMWDDELKGKRGFLSSGIDTLIKMVNEDSDRTEIQKGCERDLPFCKHITVECRLAYYDPNYEVKKAFKEGKEIQFQSTDGEWNSIVGEDMLKWYIEEGCKLRVKPDCPCANSIDSKACVGCEQSEDGKRKFGQIEYYPPRKERGESDKKYKPYETVDEFIQDFDKRFPTATQRPAHTMPLIWLRYKNMKADREFVYGFRERGIKIDDAYWALDELFKAWTYLDGSPCGKEC